jgi:hypothetical protein
MQPQSIWGAKPVKVKGSQSAKTGPERSWIKKFRTRKQPGLGNEGRGLCHILKVC